jgi:uncharacterized protein DUF6286
MSTLADTANTPAQGPTMAPAKPPVAAPAATGVTLAVALVLIALGVIAVRDVLLWAGAITGTPWIINALNYFDGLTRQTWMLPGGLAIALLGALMVLAAVKPRRRTHQPLSAADTWIPVRDITRLARGAAQALTGVGAVTATGSARKITLAVTPLAGYEVDTLRDTAHAVVTEALAPMARPPRVRIRIKEGKLP